MTEPIKIAFFVEGQTERIFVQNFLEKYLLKKQNHSFKMSFNRRGKTTEIVKYSVQPEYEVLIRDIGGDGGERVLDVLIEEAPGLINQGYSFFLSLSDLEDPTKRGILDKIIDLRQNRINALPFGEKVKFIIAVMMIEAWFLADYNFLSKKHLSLTTKFIKEKLNLDIENDNPQDYNNPAVVINNIYQLINEKYRKKEKDSHNITSLLNYDFLMSDHVTNKVSSLGHFCNCVEKIFH